MSDSCVIDFNTLSTSESWKPFKPKIDAIWIIQATEDSKFASALLRFEAGAGVPAHLHSGNETVYCVSGSFSDERGVYEAGQFRLNAKESTHTSVFSEKGCVVLMTWEQMPQFI